MTIKKVLTIVVLLLSVNTMTAPLASEQQEQQKEIIYIATWISYHPAYGSSLTKMVVLDFQGVDGLPIDTDREEFKEAVKVKIKLMSWGAQGYGVRVFSSFDISLDNRTANKYATRICDEIMDIINMSHLGTIYRKTYIGEFDENTIDVLIDRGFMPMDLSSIGGLLNFRPHDGFAKLITEELLHEAAAPKDGLAFGEVDLVRLEYTLYKESGKFRWNFLTQFNVNTGLKDEEWVETLDLGSILMKKSMIEPSNQRDSKVYVDIPKRHSIPDATYSMILQSIHPRGVQQENATRFLVTYDVTVPIDNVVARIFVRKEGQDFPVEAITLVTLVLVVIVVALAFLVKRKHKKHLQRRDHSFFKPAPEIMGREL
jgi:hypothetical protein